MERIRAMNENKTGLGFFGELLMLFVGFWMLVLGAVFSDVMFGKRKP